jgi:hypothetical protein
MAAQERVAGQFHTLMAIDSDVVHMAAFPLEHLSLGSVFHAWGPLRDRADHVKSATRETNAPVRLAAIEQIFLLDAARIPLLTTLALAEYIFRWHAPDDCFKSYAVLPPHALEWDRARQRAKGIAAQWHETLPNYVRTEDITRIIGNDTDSAHIAASLLDRMPETLSVLFPAQLRADHADRTLFEFELAGLVGKLDRFPKSLPGFDELLSSPEAGFLQSKIVEFLIRDAMKSPGLSMLSERERENAVSLLNKRLTSDARVLTWLHQVNLNPSTQTHLELEGEAKPFRAILVTASAKVWRAAREFGLAASCLRSPTAYLGEGRFFDWAFKGLVGDDNPLYSKLRRGLLSQWLEPLVVSGRNTVQSAKAAVPDTTYLECVHEWERLMSHLATSLNLASPTSGLQRAISQAASDGGGRDLVEVLTAQLSQKIVSVTLRLSQSANETGLRAPSFSSVLTRNLPPVLLGPVYDGAEAVLSRIRSDDLGDEALRNQVIGAITGLQPKPRAGKDGQIARDYLQAILMSLLWMRLGQWSKARDVVRSAVGFVVSMKDKSISATANVDPWDINGDEALYLLAVTGRLAAKNRDDIFEAQAALLASAELDKLAGTQREGYTDLRFAAEEQSRGVAEVLFASSSNLPFDALGALRLELVLHAFDGEQWEEVRKPWLATAIGVHQSPAQAPNLSYARSYALQQMYCAVLMRFMLAYAPLHELVTERSKRHRAVANSVHAEFVRFSMACGAGNVSCVADSTTPRQIRAAYQCWTDKGQRGKDSGKLLREQFGQLLNTTTGNENGAAGVDQRRTEWMHRQLAKGWLV